MEYYIIDALVDNHVDNARHYTMEDAINFAEELIEIEKQSCNEESKWDGRNPCEGNIEECLEHFCYKMIPVKNTHKSGGELNMKNLFGITHIQVQQFILNSSNESTYGKLNAFLEEYDGNIIDIQFVGQSLGQICAIVTFKIEED